MPRNHHLFSVPVGLGEIYTGAPRTTPNLGGSACDATGLISFSTTTNPTFQANVQAEQNKLNNDMSAFKFYPVISAGFGFSFQLGLFGARREAAREMQPTAQAVGGPSGEKLARKGRQRKAQDGSPGYRRKKPEQVP